MDRRQVQSRDAVTLIGGAEFSAELLEEALNFAPVVVAADGGADAAFGAGLTPVAVIGDLDSITDDARGRLDHGRIIEVTEQESTDFEKCLARIDAPAVIAVGFTDGRLDHSLAVLSVMARGVGPRVVLLGEEDCVVSLNGPIDLPLDPGTRVSLFPMAPTSGRSVGLEWPIDGLVLSPMGRVGTSNRVIGPVTIIPDGPGMLLITPRAALGMLLGAMPG